MQICGAEYHNIKFNFNDLLSYSVFFFWGGDKHNGTQLPYLKRQIEHPWLLMRGQLKYFDHIQDLKYNEVRIIYNLCFVEKQKLTKEKKNKQHKKNRQTVYETKTTLDHLKLHYKTHTQLRIIRPISQCYKEAKQEESKLNLNPDWFRFLLTLSLQRVFCSDPAKTYNKRAETENSKSHQFIILALSDLFFLQH